MCDRSAGGSLKLLIALLIFSCSSSKAADRKSFRIQLGGGLTYSSLKLTESTTESKFTGGGYSAEAGVLMPLGTSVGFTSSIDYGNAIDNNTSSETTYLERATLQQTALKVGLEWDAFELGVGFRSLSLKILTVSSSVAPIESELTGNLPFAYARVFFENNSMFRFALEGNYHKGSVGSHALQELVGQIKIFLPFGNRPQANN